MNAEKAVGIVVRMSDWSETSRIATIWTKELGRVRVLAKGGRRLRSSFETALDLLSVCSIVLIRKSSGGLDLLTEARVDERFAGLRKNLRGLNAAYYVAELLGDGTQDYDPHLELYERSLQTLRELSAGGDVSALVSRYELAWLNEIGLCPVLDRCTACHRLDVPDDELNFSSVAGGVVCSRCMAAFLDRRAISRETLTTIQSLAAGSLPTVGPEVRWQLEHYVCGVLGKRPRLLSFLG